ncbi:hypothetical protein [Paenibacillus nanensis]|uniref:hypothetical protein n=1 Tax=Paenibacillus nanensis TaxID=393251 RepID=UPI0011C36D8F|nr:hypothetical protein [Paenibacillus nanensis]
MTNHFADSFSQDLISAVSQNEEFDLAQLTEFEWDKMYVFYPYISREEMERRIGREWTTYSYIGYYVFQKTSLGDHPLNDDSVNKIVFTNGNKIVLDVTFYRDQVDLTQLKPLINREEAKFLVQDSVLKQMGAD